MLEPTPLLATDLDGTLIPLGAANADHQANTPADPAIRESADAEPLDGDQHAALEMLRRQCDEAKLAIVFVTGRHHDSVMQVMAAVQLPKPQWIICDVGSTLLALDHKTYRPVEAYVNHLEALSGGADSAALAAYFPPHDDFILQESANQGRHKRSYYCAPAKLDQHVARIEQTLDQHRLAYRVVSSVDPFNGKGLIDLLPQGTDKAAALHWWADWQNHPLEQIVYAGDSGNDYAALTCGLRAILVGNADQALRRQVTEHHRQAGTPERIYAARGLATAGVLEGCRHFGLIEQRRRQSPDWQSG